MQKIGIITQARMSSTRLPGKVLLKIKGKTILEYHLDRLKSSTYPVYIATTTNTTDDVLVEFAQSHALPYYRGDEKNVLQRFVKCAEENKLDIIVRVTSDCPLIDGALIKKGIEIYLQLNNPDVYISNGLEESFPRGFDFEIFSFVALKNASLNAFTDAQKEHVTPYLIENRSGSTLLKNIAREKDASLLRLTIDTQADFDLIVKLILEFNGANLTSEELIKVLEEHPELPKINAHIQQKTNHE